MPISFVPRCDGKIFHCWIEKRLQLRGKHEAGKFSKEVKKRLLQHVECEIAVAGETKRQRSHPIAITKVQRLERDGVTTIDGGNEFQVRARVEAVLRFRWCIHKTALGHNSRQCAAASSYLSERSGQKVQENSEFTPL